MAKDKQITKPKEIGLWISTSLVIGNMVGAGVFLLPAALAAYGGISLVGWFFSSLGAIVLALVFGRLSKMIPKKDGGPYAYSKLGFGSFVGFLVAWGYWISIWIANAAIAIAFVGALSVFFPVLGTNPVAAVLAGLGAIWFLTWVNSRGIRESGIVQLITTILKLLPLLIIILGGFFFFNPEHFFPFNTSGESDFSAIALTATLTFYAYVGFESATIPAGNIKNPEKTIPRATLLGTGLTMLFYILSTVVVMGMIPMETLAASPAPFADAMEIMSGKLGKYIVAGGVAVAAFGALNGWILVQGQIARATAIDQLFPVIFKKENKKGAPIYGIIIGSVLSSVLMLMNFSDGLVEQFRFMIQLSTLCCLVPYLFSAAAYVLLALKKVAKGKNPIFIHLLGGLAFLFSFWAIFGAGEEVVFSGFLLLLAGVPVYVWLKISSEKS